MIYLYLKTHNTTGLKYLGKTKNDPFKYLGSGKVWKEHLGQHGKDVSTIILRECANNKEVNVWGRYYSELFDVVQSKEFANLIPETGGGVGNSNQVITEEQRNKISQALKGHKQSAETVQKRINSRLGYKHSKETIQKIKHSHIGKTISDQTKMNMSESAKKRKKHAWTGKKRQTKTCPHCNKTGADNLMNRWHFDNCKLK